MGTIRAGAIISPMGQFNQFRKAKDNWNISIQGGKVIHGRSTDAAYELTIKVSTTFDLAGFTDMLRGEYHPNTKSVRTPTNIER